MSKKAHKNAQNARQTTLFAALVTIHLLHHTCINCPKCKTHTRAIFTIHLLLYTCINFKKCKNVKLLFSNLAILELFKMAQNRLAGLKIDLRGRKSLKIAHFYCSYISKIGPNLSNLALNWLF